MAKKSVEPRLPSIREVLIGNRIVGVEERGDFLILTLEDGYQVRKPWDAGGLIFRDAGGRVQAVMFIATGEAAQALANAYDEIGEDPDEDGEWNGVNAFAAPAAEGNEQIHHRAKYGDVHRKLCDKGIVILESLKEKL